MPVAMATQFIPTLIANLFFPAMILYCGNACAELVIEQDTGRDLPSKISLGLQPTAKR